MILPDMIPYFHLQLNLRTFFLYVDNVDIYVACTVTSTYELSDEDAHNGDDNVYKNVCIPFCHKLFMRMGSHTFGGVVDEVTG